MKSSVSCSKLTRSFRVNRDNWRQTEFNRHIDRVLSRTVAHVFFEWRAGERAFVFLQTGPPSLASHITSTNLCVNEWLCNSFTEILFISPCRRIINYCGSHNYCLQRKCFWLNSRHSSATTELLNRKGKWKLNYNVEINSLRFMCNLLALLQLHFALQPVD